MQIAAAFTDHVKSTDVETLIKAAEAASAAADRGAVTARARALDPTLASGAVAQARECMDDHAFRRDRMSAALEKLRLRLVELRDAEEDARRRVAYDEAAANRDEVAGELAGFYPEFAQKLVHLLSRLVESNYNLGVVNAKLPKGAVRLEPAELVAKGMVGRYVLGAVSVTECYLPPWTPHSPHRWPSAK
jgi:hypothetical protein